MPFVIVLFGLAHGQVVPDPVAEKERQLILDRDADAQPNPRHVILPDPLEQTANQKEAEAQDVRERSSTANVRAKPVIDPTVPPRIARKVPRPFRGRAPEYLHGRYHVVEVTEGGQTEDYRNKMERAGRALDDDCIVLRTRFDFGGLPAEPGTRYRPRSVTITRIQECSVGGLGKYAEELTTVLDVTYEESDDHVTLTLPQAKVMSDYVRLKRPSEGDMPSPPQWLAPATIVERDREQWRLIAEPAARGRLPVLHLTNDSVVWHLEPDPGDSPFDIADRQVAEGGP